MEFRVTQNGFQALGKVLMVQGLQFLIGAGAVYFIGLEEMLTYLNDELLVLPGGLSRIMGITTHLDIPLEVPYWLVLLGAIIFSLGMFLVVGARRK